GLINLLHKVRKEPEETVPHILCSFVPDVIDLSHPVEIKASGSDLNGAEAVVVDFNGSEVTVPATLLAVESSYRMVLNVPRMVQPPSGAPMLKTTSVKVFF